MDVVEIDGLRLAFRRAGNGPAVVFVHGGAEDGRAWTPQLDALSDEFTVIAWDEPGAGGSGDVPAGFALSDYADHLAGLIRALAISPCTLVGLSWGVTVILELYRRHPSVARSLVLADGYAGWRGSSAPTRPTPASQACATSRRAASTRPSQASSPALRRRSSCPCWRRWQPTHAATAC